MKSSDLISYTELIHECLTQNSLEISKPLYSNALFGHWKGIPLTLILVGRKNGFTLGCNLESFGDLQRDATFGPEDSYLPNFSYKVGEKFSDYLSSTCSTIIYALNTCASAKVDGRQGIDACCVACPKQLSCLAFS